MINIGIIGTGFGKTQAQVFQALDGCQVSALCGMNLEKTDRIAAELGVARAYNSYHDLLSDENIDMVSIATPNHLHKPMFLDALQYGKHIILEKPAGLNAIEIQEMIGASKGYEKLIVVDHPMRFNPMLIYILKQISNGVLGQVTNVQISAYTNYVSADDKPYIWIDDPARGGGQILNMGTHLIDVTRYLLDMPSLVSGNLISKKVLDAYPDGTQNVQIEHQISANLDWNNGTNSIFFNTTTSFGYQGFEIRVLGSKGVVVYDDTEGLRISTNNSQPLTRVNMSDNLKHINAGKSFVSKSFKYFASDLIGFINGEKIVFDYCTLQQAYENMVYLEKMRDNVGI